MDMKPKDSDKMNGTTETDTVTYVTTTTYPNSTLQGPYSPDHDVTLSAKHKQQKNLTNIKKDYFPGPFSLQHLDEETFKGQTKQKPETSLKTKPSKENPLINILAPFHLSTADIPDIHHSKGSIKKPPVFKEKEEPFIPDSKFEDDIQDTNEGLLTHYPFISPPSKKPSKYDKSKPKPTGYGPEHTIPYHSNFPDDHTYSGLFEPSGPVEFYQPNNNNSATGGSLPTPVPTEKGGKGHFGLGIDHEFQYEGEKGPPHSSTNPYNPDQIYFVQSQGFPHQPQPNGSPNQDMYQVQHFQIPFHPENAQPGNIPVDVFPPRYNKKKPIDKHHEQSLPQDLLTHLHSLAPPFLKGSQIQPHVRPEEIIHYVQPNPQLNSQQHPPANYLSPEEIYLYQSQDKLNGGQIRSSPQPIQSQTSDGSFHIHSPSIPASPSQRVEEILAQIHQQNPNQFPHQHFGPQPQYPETLLTQHSSHAAYPLGVVPGPNNSRPGWSLAPRLVLT